MMNQNPVIVIFGLPRSGTTWLGQILNSHPLVLYRYQPLFSYEFKDYLDEDFSLNQLESFHYNLQHAKSEFVCPNHTFSKENPEFLVYKNVRYHHLAKRMLELGQVKIIFLSRDPVQVLNSWYNAPKEFSPDWEIEKEWLHATSKNQNRSEEFFGFDGWRRAEKIHRENAILFPNKVRIVEYENLIQDDSNEIHQLLNWIGLRNHKQVDDFLKDSKERHDGGVYSVFKMPAKMTLPISIQEQIKAHTKKIEYVPYHR